MIGSIIGLCYSWKLALVGIACYPLIVSAGYIRLVSHYIYYLHSLLNLFVSQRVVILKDQRNKKAYESSAQLACEAAGAVRTVASLTREEDCLNIYSQSLEIPLRTSNRSAILSNFIYALSQSMMFYVIALVFYFGAKLVSQLEINTTAFFICLFVSRHSRHCELNTNYFKS